MKEKTENATIKDLTEGPLTRQLILFSLPIMGANLLQALYTLVDLWAVGKFADAAAISAVSVAGQVVFLMHAVAIGLNNGGQVLIAQQVGAKDYKRLSATIGTMLSGCVLATTVIAVIGAVGVNFWLELLNTPAEAMAGGVSYMLICCLGAPFMCASGSLCAVLRGVGDSRRPMYILAVSALSNMVMDIIFVAGFGWGAAGAAWATTIAQFLGSVYALICVYGIRKQLGFDFKPASFRIRKEPLLVLLRLGIPLVIMNASVNISMMVITAFVNSYGVAASAITGIGSKLSSLVFVITNSMQTAVSALVAQNFAARKMDRVRKANRDSNLFCIVCFIFIGILVWFFPTQVIGIFTNASETEVLALAPDYLHVQFFLYLAFCLMTTSIGHINGVGFTSLNLVIALLDSVIGRIGLAVIFGKVMGMGVIGFWWGSAVAAYISVVMALTYYFFGHWEKRSLLLE